MTDANSLHGAPAVPAELANDAADDLKSCVEPERLDQQKFPWLFPPRSTTYTEGNRSLVQGEDIQ